MRLKNDKKPPNKLRWLSLQTRNVDQCVGDYDGKLILDSNLIIFAKKPEMDICTGDLSAPMVHNGTEEVPMVYGKVSKVLYWITRAIYVLERKNQN